MRTVKVIVNRDWKFLAEVCINPQVDLIDSEREVKEGEPFIEFDDGFYRTFVMTRSGVKVPKGKHPTLNTAIFKAI